MVQDDYWTGPRAREELDRLEKWPEGPTLRERLRSWVGTDSVLEFGCGLGRLASLFDPRGYVGVDLSLASIEEARRRNPQHTFLPAESLPARKAALASSVLQHIADERIEETIEALAEAADRLIVVECLGRSHRGLPLQCNRDLKDYERLGAGVGWKVTVLHRWPSAFKATLEITALRLG